MPQAGALWWRWKRLRLLNAMLFKRRLVSSRLSSGGG
jgi:hypothetical protein